MQRFLIIIGLSILFVGTIRPAIAQDNPPTPPPDRIPITVENVGELTCLREILGPAGLFEVSFNFDGSILGGHYGIQSTLFWDVATGTLLTEIADEFRDVQSSMLWHPTENRVAVSGKGADTTIWTLPELTPWSHSFPGPGLAFSPDGSYLATAAYNQDEGATLVHLWAVDDGTPGVYLPHEISWDTQNAVFSADGTQIIFPGPRSDAFFDGSNSIQVWDVASLTRVAEYDAFKYTDDATTPIVTPLAYTPDRTWIAYASTDTIVFWNLLTDIWQSIYIGGGFIKDVALSPDGTLLAAALDAFGTGELVVLDRAAGTKIATIEIAEPVIQVAFSPDGTLLVTGSREGVIQLWGVH